MATMQPQTIEAARAILDTLPPKYAALAALGIATGGRISELLALRRGDLIDAEKMDFRAEVKIIKLKTRPRQSISRRLDKLEELIKERNAPRNFAGERLDGWTPPAPKPPAKQYRRFTIPQGLRHYIAAHLNEEARRGYIHAGDYVFRGRNGGPMQPQAARHFFARHLGANHGTHWLRKTYANFMYSVFSARYGGDTYRAAREVQTLLGHRNIETTARYLRLDTANRAEVVRNAFDEVFPDPPAEV